MEDFERPISSLDIMTHGIEPITLNNAYVTTSSCYKIKSVDTQKWLYSLKMAFNPYLPMVKKFYAAWDRKTMFLEAKYSWFYPEKKLFCQEKTVRGAVSQTSKDWSNIPKIPDDLIFNAIINIDDGHICDGRVLKLPSWDDKFHMRLQIFMWHKERLYELSKRFSGKELEQI